MAYQVLARKWRPQNFHTMVGQEHVLRALVHALDEQRLHHAYLFAGTRGVGKTTIARILARCLNCEEGVSSSPCGVCSSCVEITEGRFVDLIEVDAASRTKVEDTRELLDNVQYAPTRGRFKVYLIDEVHMLSTSSFNALLKTLEEPPPHVKFLLATTDPQKLPITVLSRCLQFNLKNMPAEQVAGHLRHVLTSETIAFAEASLWQLGRAAKGSMRDALSLTDQAIAFCGGDLTESAVNQMLGSIDQGKVVEIVSQLQQGNASELLKLIGELGEQGQDFTGALEDLLSLLHQMAICQVLPEAPVSVQFDRAKVKELAQQTSPADVQLFYQMGIMARKDLELAPDLQAGFEMALLRMLAFRPQQHAGQMKITEPQTHTQPQAQAQVPESITATEAVVESAAELLVEQVEQVDESTAQGMPATEMASVPDAPNEEPSMPEAALVQEIAPVQDSPPWEEAPMQAQQPVFNHAHEEQQGELEPQLEPQLEQAAAAEPASTPEPDSESEGESETAVAGGLMPAKSGRDWTLADLTQENWVKVFNDLNLSGMTHGIAANMVFAQRQGTKLQFTLQQGQSSMLNDTHQGRMREALEAMFGCNLELTINIGETQVETPFANRQRRETEHQQQAIMALENDANVASLTTAFNGQLDTNSVLPVNPIEIET
ncbi:MAG: DNA polymerase III subunit gamma/tau [Oceanospirillaceae bacterium]|nr:DNA polymerase III subunit gamma/tau [Oceanospirillaceae bacterium]